MTLLGKIFTGLIVMMSVLFLGLAISVFATHVNWKRLADNPNPQGGEPAGLQQQLAKQVEVNRQLKERQADLLASMALEQTARRYALAALETKLATRSAALQTVTEDLAKWTAIAGTTAQSLVAVQSELTSITAEVKTLRDVVQLAEKDADDKFLTATKLTDEVNQMRVTKSEMEERQKPLEAQVAALRDVADKMGVRVDIGTDGTVRTDVDRIPPNVKGEVVEIGEKDLVEISVGADDGILVDHQLDVYRQGVYLGRVRVVKTSHDRAVAEIIPDFKQGTIRKGDRVATKFG